MFIAEAQRGGKRLKLKVGRMVVDKNIGQRMVRMSFICAVLVVFLHSYFLDLSASNDGSLAWWTQDVFSQGFCRAAVPRLCGILTGGRV